MNITPKQLRLFLALVETESITAAARRCHVTQPTASMQLRGVSEAVGLPLYEFSGRRFRLTEAGQALAAAARQVEQAWEVFAQQTAALRGLERGHLRVAVVSTAKYFVPRWLGRFCQAHPEVDVALEVLNRDGVVQRLRDQRDDLYVMSHPPTDLALTTHVLMPNRLYLIAPESHALAGQACVPLSAFADDRFIVRESGSGTRWAMSQAFSRLGFQPRSVMVLGSNEAIKEAVAGGLGVAVLSEHAIHRAPVAGVAVVEVEGLPWPAQWYAVHPAGAPLAPIASAFLDHLLSAALGDDALA